MFTFARLFNLIAAARRNRINQKKSYFPTKLGYINYFFLIQKNLCGFLKKIEINKSKK